MCPIPLLILLHGRRPLFGPSQVSQHRGPADALHSLSDSALPLDYLIVSLLVVIFQQIDLFGLEAAAFLNLLLEMVKCLCLDVELQRCLDAVQNRISLFHRPFVPLGVHFRAEIHKICVHVPCHLLFQPICDAANIRVIGWDLIFVHQRQGHSVSDLLPLAFHPFLLGDLELLLRVLALAEKIVNSDHRLQVGKRHRRALLDQIRVSPPQRFDRRLLPVVAYGHWRTDVTATLRHRAINAPQVQAQRRSGAATHRFVTGSIVHLRLYQPVEMPMRLVSAHLIRRPD